MTTEHDQDESIEPDPVEFEPAGYATMFKEWVVDQTWITSADKPLVFHIRQLCVQLDRGGAQAAAMFNAYLNATEKLNNRKPADAETQPQLPGQTSLLDFGFED